MPIMDNLQLSEQNIQPYHKDIPIGALIDYHEKGLSTRQIAKLVGCSNSNVYDRLIRSGYNLAHQKAFNDNKPKVLSFIHEKIVNNITDEEIKKTSFRDKVVALGILVDKEQLLLGKPTSITSFEGLPDAGLSQAISGLLSKAERVGIRLTDIVGELPSQLRDQASKLLPSSLPAPDDPVTINAKQ
jgi:hypothetical protein